MEEQIAQWKESGSHEGLLNYATAILNTLSNDLPHPVAAVIQLVLLEALSNGLTTTQVASFLSQLSGRRSGPSSADVASIIVDLFWVMEVEIEVENENRATNSGRLEKLCLLAKAIIQQGFIPENIMKERWEISFLEQVGLIQNARLFTKRVIRINTAQLYKQHKYNLLQEESEGYSKLITELASGTADCDDDMQIVSRASTVLDNVISLIGYFDLDPNRVLAIALDVFAASITTHYRFFIQFLKMSPWSSQSTGDRITSKNKACAQILGFMFQDLQATPRESPQDAPELGI
ncbi:THO complex subunit 2 [Entomortierella chlamydospora]|uniref:THO complex subunit 2 n=1 Tax=Entomortierella chlamydospora TaxID=101097 RepID=A0A9P6MXI8_9FUNG|nr:THO complex subunit 2 [Entomortierella chlamydospora]